MPEHFEKTKFQQKRRLKQTLKTNLRKLKTNLKNKHRVATAASAQPSAGSNASEDGECGDGNCGDGRVCKRATRPSSLRTNSSSILSLHRRASETLPAFQTSCPRPRRDQPASRTHSLPSVSRHLGFQPPPAVDPHDRQHHRQQTDANPNRTHQPTLLPS